MTPVRPPATKIASAPAANSIGTVSITRPSRSVAMKAKICTPVGIATASEAAEKKPSEIAGSPVVYMWWTHRPKLKKPVPTAASTIQV